MHTINIHRERIEGCWEVEVDGKPTSASPSKRIVGEVVLDAIQRLGEAVLISCTDTGPANRDRLNRRQHNAATARVSASRAQPEPGRP